MPRLAASFLSLTLLAFAVPFGVVRADSPTLFVRSAVEHADATVSLPLYRGTSRGRTVWYVVLDASEGGAADRLGVNRAQKLARARGTTAVQRVSMAGGVIELPATVDFAPARSVVPGPGGFPPLVAEPGAVGEPGYSPLVQLPDGTILNAPHVANDTGMADKVVAIDQAARRVRLQETSGFQGDRAVHYVSTDASDAGVAALENVTFAPALAAAPFAGGDGTNSARASLVAFANGQTGAANPERQGLSSALLDGLEPLNVLSWNPSQGRYSPLWDVFPAVWTPHIVAAGANLRQTDFGTVENLAQRGSVTSLDGGPWRALNIVVNCPIISRE